MIDNYRPSLLKLATTAPTSGLWWIIRLINLTSGFASFAGRSQNDDELLSLYSQLRRMNTTTCCFLNYSFCLVSKLHVSLLICIHVCWLQSFWLSRAANVPVSTCFSASGSHLTAISVRSSAIKIKLKAQLSLLSIGTRSRLIKMPAVASRIGDFPFVDSPESFASNSPTSAVCTVRRWSSWLNDSFISTACDLMFTTSNEHRLFTKRSC